MTIQTIIKSVSLSENWEENNHELFKKYMTDVYNTNQSINDIFDDKNIKVISMDLEIKVHVKEVPQDQLQPDPEANETEQSASSFAESIATSLIVDAIDNPTSSVGSLDNLE